MSHGGLNRAVPTWSPAQWASVIDEAARLYSGAVVRLSLPSHRLIALSCTPNTGALVAACGDGAGVVLASAGADEAVSPITPKETATRESARNRPPILEDTVA